MIQAGRNGIIFHSCHAAFLFYIYLSLLAAPYPFVKPAIREKQPSAFPISRVLSFFPFVPFLSAGREHGSTPIPRSAFCRHFVDIPFCDTTPFWSVSRLLPPQSNPNGSPGNSCRFLRTCSRNAHRCAGGRIALSLPLQLRFPALFRNGFPAKSSSFSVAKIVCRQERLWKS